MNIKVIFEDNYLLVLDKPAGLTVTSDETTLGQTTLQDILQKQYNFPVDRGGIVHRLDKDTSGVLVVAKTSETLLFLQKQFKQRLIKKKYRALVHGTTDEKGEVKTILGRNPGNRKKFAVIDEGVEGREAITSYKKIYDLQFIIYNFEKLIQEFNKNQKRYYESNAKNYSFLEVYPATGRTHQIRVHLKYLGYPIVSDQTYCPAKLLRLDLKWCKRQFLHAELLGFYHPESEKWTLFTSELPEDLEKALEILEKK